MKQKNSEKQKKKDLKNQYLENPPHENLEEKMLENNSYYDIDILNEYNQPILDEIKYWEEEFKPSGNMGKWYASIRIEKLKKKLRNYVK